MELYKKGTVNYNRLATDKLFIDENIKAKFTGKIEETYRFVEEFQLISPEEWKRFVEQFRVNSDDHDFGWRGEFWGKMMRGGAFVYSYTKNSELYNVLTETVEDILTAMDSDGRISTYSLDREFRGWDMWSRKYVLLGMQYYLEICTSDELSVRVINAMKAQTDYIMSKIGPGKKDITETSDCWRGVNSSSILEPVVRLYMLTGEKKYLDFAEYIVERGGASICNIFEIAYENITDPYQFPVVKAYETISCFEGLLEYYRVTGIEKWKQAIINFAKRLIDTDVTIIGSSGTVHEYFDHSTVRQCEPELSKGMMQETCVTVTWMKFCMQLLALTGESCFADEFEKSLYNAYLGAVNTDNSVNSEFILERYPDVKMRSMPFDSYSPLIAGVRGTGVGGLKLMPDNNYYGCCACIGSAGIGMVHKVATMVNKNGIAVNLYIDGKVNTVTPEGKELELNFATEYPCGDKVKISVGCDEEEFNIDLRIPSWSKETAVCVNGDAVSVTEGYTSISRKWKNGDEIVLTLDMRTSVMHPVWYGKDIVMTNIAWMYNYVSPVVVMQSQESMYHIAMRRGPIVLARDARLDGTVDEAVEIAYDENGYVALENSDKAGFNAMCEYQVPLKNGKSFTVIDYASAGKTWDDKSKFACWLPTKKYW